jgi:DNA end-binding protein Ku
VSIPVGIYNAVKSKAEISFRQIHKPSGRRVSGIGKIENSDIVKGYEVDTDTYVTLEPEEIDAVKLESTKTIDHAQFVDIAEIDWRYFERPYYIVPADPIAREGYTVIRDGHAQDRQGRPRSGNDRRARMAGGDRTAGRWLGNGDAALRR